MHLDADVSRWEDVDRLVSTAVERFGRLDVMVCNAGIAGRYSKPLLETTEEDWDAIMAVNLRGVVLCCKRAIAEMVDQEPIGEARGRVIIISLQDGMIGPSRTRRLCREQGRTRQSGASSPSTMRGAASS